MLPYAGYVDPESTLAIGVHHDGHLEATERTFCSLYHTFMFGFHPFAHHPSRNVFFNCFFTLLKNIRHFPIDTFREKNK